MLSLSLFVRMCVSCLSRSISCQQMLLLRLESFVFKRNGRQSFMWSCEDETNANISEMVFPILNWPPSRASAMQIEKLILKKQATFPTRDFLCIWEESAIVYWQSNSLPYVLHKQPKGITPLDSSVPIWISIFVFSTFFRSRNEMKLCVLIRISRSNQTKKTFRRKLIKSFKLSKLVQCVNWRDDIKVALNADKLIRQKAYQSFPASTTHNNHWNR